MKRLSHTQQKCLCRLQQLAENNRPWEQPVSIGHSRPTLMVLLRRGLVETFSIRERHGWFEDTYSITALGCLYLQAGNAVSAKVVACR